MKIGNGLDGIGGARPAETKTRRGKNVSKDDQSSTPDSTLDLTSTSTQMQQLESYLSNLDDIDMDKVERVRQSIADGTYTVNEDAIAQKLLSSILDGLRSQAK